MGLERGLTLTLPTFPTSGNPEAYRVQERTYSPPLSEAFLGTYREIDLRYSGGLQYWLAIATSKIRFARASSILCLLPSSHNTRNCALSEARVTDKTTDSLWGNERRLTPPFGNYAAASFPTALASHTTRPLPKKPSEEKKLSMGPSMPFGYPSTRALSFLYSLLFS